MHFSLKHFALLLITGSIFSCAEKQQQFDKLKNPDLFREAVQNLTDISVYDIFSPPVASRVYAYPNIAAYEVMATAFPEKYHSLAGQLKGLKKAPELPENVNPYLAALYAFNIVGKSMIFSEDKMTTFQQQFDDKISKYNIPRRVKKRAHQYAIQMAEHILNWSKGDNYHQTRTYPKYTVLEGDSFWKPTPPDYMDGIEPNWNQIRTMVIDSASQFSPEPPLEFNLSKGSPFQKQLQEVYDVGKNLNPQQTEIASFWDCNPYVTYHKGHAMFATKKITPGGHWIGITDIASRQAGSDFGQTVAAFTEVSIALFDAFISCWDEKWNTLIVRPETLIHKYYDEDWLPALQTPPFPEYTSGHSVVSKASAVVLTKRFGTDFSFEDTTEIKYGLPVRSFKSLHEAADEAAISRLYGGIHYRMAIDQGVIQGDNVGEFIASKLLTEKKQMP